MESAGQIVLVVLGFLTLGSFVLLLLYQYANFKKTRWYVLLTTFIAWYLSFAIILLIPLDISSNNHINCLAEKGAANCTEPWLFLSTPALNLFWRILYWSTFLMCWIISPVMKSYATSGHFYRYDRIVDALKDNLIFYLVCVVVMLVIFVLIVIQGKLAPRDIFGVAIAAANAWGLFLVVILLGYAMVEIPKALWRLSNKDLTLKLYRFEIVNLKAEVDAARKEVDTALKLLKKYDENVKDYDPFKPYLQQIIDTAKEANYASVLRGEGEYDPYSYSKLVSLHTRVKDAVFHLHRAKYLYRIQLEKAFELEDVMQAKSSNAKSIQYSFKDKRTGKFALYLEKWEWLWKMYLESPTLKFLTVVTGILSISIAWSEIVFTSEKVDLSIFSLLLNKPKNLSFLWQWMFVFVPVTYITGCCYWSLFKIRFFNFYRLIPHHETDAGSLLFSANYLCTLAAPIVNNFLLVIHNKEASFYQVMGPMFETILGSVWNNYFPILLVVMCLFNLFNLYSRLLNKCCIKKFRDFAFHENFSETKISQGKEIIARERQMRTTGVEIDDTNAPQKEQKKRMFDFRKLFSRKDEVEVELISKNSSKV